jgi:hypothetical protein
VHRDPAQALEHRRHDRREPGLHVSRAGAR